MITPAKTVNVKVNVETEGLSLRVSDMFQAYGEARDHLEQTLIPAMDRFKHLLADLSLSVARVNGSEEKRP